MRTRTAELTLLSAHSTDASTTTFPQPLKPSEREQLSDLASIQGHLRIFQTHTHPPHTHTPLCKTPKGSARITPLVSSEGGGRSTAPAQYERWGGAAVLLPPEHAGQAPLQLQVSLLTHNARQWLQSCKAHRGEPPTSNLRPIGHYLQKHLH